MKIVKYQDLSPNRSHLLYGRSGTGKTTLAATYPGNKLLIDISDEGTESISDVKGLSFCEIKSAEDMEELYWKLAKSNPYDTVIVDNLSQYQQLLISQVCGKVKKGKKAGDWGTMTRQQWGKVSSGMMETITRFRGLNTTVVFICHERSFEEEDVDEELIQPVVGPALIRSVAAHLCASCSFIGHTFIRATKGQPEYCIRVGPHPVYITKVRKPRSIELPSYLSDPSFDKLDQLKKGTLNGKKVRKIQVKKIRRVQNS